MNFVHISRAFWFVERLSTGSFSSITSVQDLHLTITHLGLVYRIEPDASACRRMG